MLVMFAHLRGAMFIGWSNLDASARNPVFLPLYAATAFFHEAVVVFFVLSGFLIAGPNIDRVRTRSFSPKPYAIDRFTRIYVTAFPAMLLTLAADWAGRTLVPWTGFYEGSNSLMLERVGAQFHDSARDLLNNVAMLQPAHAPMLGSNIPLWSLSFEVWFYVWFGLVAVAAQARRRSGLLVAVLATLGLVMFHWVALVYLAIWCFGALAYQWEGWPPSIVLATLCFAASLAFSMKDGLALAVPNIPLKISDPLVGLTFAWLLALMKRRSYRFLSRTEGVNQALSNFSYSTYVIHYPAMLFLVGLIAALLGFSAEIKQGLAPGAWSLAVYVVTALSTLFVAFLFSRLFEAHTASARRWLKQRI